MPADASLAQHSCRQVDVAFVGRYALGLVIVAVLLFTCWSLARAVRSGSLRPHNEKHLIRVLQSTLLSPETAVHVVKIADRCYALGGGHGHIRLLCEIPAQDITPPFHSDPNLP